MTRSGVAAIAALVLSAAAPAWAQGTRFLTGPLGWTPTIGLKDVGFDSNVFDDAENRQEDRIGTFAAQVEGQMTLAHFKTTGSAAGDYMYFERLTGERSFARRFTLRVETPTRHLVPFGTAAYERAKERSGPEIDLRTRRITRSFGAGASIVVMARGAIQISGRREETSYDEGQIFRDVNVAERLNLDSDSAVVGVRFNVTDLTAIMTDVNLSRDRFTLKPDQNTSKLTWTAAVEFAPDAVIRGRAGIGYNVMEPRGASAMAFRGWTANVDLGYVLLGRTRFNGRYIKDTSYSIDAPYYLLTTFGGDVAQLIGGPFELLVRANRQRSNYPENTDLRIAARIDVLDTLAGGVAIRLSDTARVTITYELARRQSPIEGVQFDRRRILTSFSYGF